MPVDLIAGEKAKGETKKAIIACNDYLRMGIGRSLEKLHRTYTEHSPDLGTLWVPTKHLSILKGWSTRFGWQARTEIYDAAIEDQKNVRRREIMESGLALDYERVVKLKTLASFLEQQITEEAPDGKRPNVWLKDYKQIGSGDFAEKVEIERFNAALVAEFRASLDDLAKETGGRKQNVSMQHSGGVGVDVSVEELTEAAKRAKESEAKLLNEQ
jgi:hypothetical protein